MSWRRAPLHRPSLLQRLTEAAARFTVGCFYLLGIVFCVLLLISE